MQRIPRNTSDRRLTQAERDARDFQNAPPYGSIEKAGERAGGVLSGLLHQLERLVELPANIMSRRTGERHRCVRFFCWVCAIFFPAMWPFWLITLALASRTPPTASNHPE